VVIIALVSFKSRVGICPLSSGSTVTCVTLLLQLQNAPQNNNDMWSDFCDQRVRKLVKFTEE
jgi:hypothetical protein